MKTEPLTSAVGLFNEVLAIEKEVASVIDNLTACQESLMMVIKHVRNEPSDATTMRQMKDARRRFEEAMYHAETVKRLLPI